MKQFKIAYGPEAKKYFETTRELVQVGETDYTDVAAAVLTNDETSYVENILATKFGIPIFIVLVNNAPLDENLVGKVHHIMDDGNFDQQLYNRQIEAAASQYEENVLPPFFKGLSEYVETGYENFSTPGHHGGQFFRKHPAGRYLYEFYGENLFRSDISSSDMKMGDLLIHEGYPYEAQKHAAKVYNSDKTYFVLNGTSASNKVVTSALLTPGDLVLFDRNNHKSVHQGALILAGATPIYLETARNPFGFIGGIDSHCFDEKYLRELVAKTDPVKAKEKRPFRLAVFQLGTYDGTIYNARQVVDKIGHLCDYILFDSAWVGYEQFIPMMKDCSPLLLDLTPDDPGIIVTQSVHKQQAGFSQASQIHKKDCHIKGQARYCDHKRFNNAFMLQASTSPFYPLFATLDVNAKIHEGEAGKRLWMDCVKLGIETRKSLLRNCSMIKPFIPKTVNGANWEEYPTEEIASNVDFFAFKPDEKWHSFPGYAEHQYFVDPCKLLLTTPGIDLNSGGYSDFGIPATILANYLRENGVIPEKCDLNSILFLLTPAETPAKLNNLVSLIARFELAIKNDDLLKEVLPSVYKNNSERYENYSIRQLCLEMHNFYKKNNVKQLQQNLFRAKTFPKYAMSPQKAQWALMRGQGEIVPLTDIVGRTALEGALPYPPGIICIVPGEIWNDTAQKYFLTLEEGINQFPGFAPEIQGVYLQHEGNHIHSYGYVLKGN